MRRLLDRVVANLPLGLQACAGRVVHRALRLEVGHLGIQRATQHDVGAAPGHVGGDGHRARPAGLRHDVRLALVLLGVQHLMRDPGIAQRVAEQFRYLDRGGADQHRLALPGAGLDLVGHRAVLAGAVEEHQVGMVLADHRLVGRDDHHFQAVDALELVGLGVGGAGHACQLLVHAEQVLEGDRGQGLVLALHRHAFLRLHRLVQAIGPAPARQGATGEFVDDHHLVVAHDVVDIALVDRMRAHRGVEVVDHVDVLRCVQALVLAEDAGLAQQRLGMFLAGLGQVDLLALLVDEEVAVAVFLLLPCQRRHDPVDPHVEFGRLVGGAGDDQRGARLVDQDRVDLVHDRVVQAALEAVFLGQRHVVAQVVEAEFVVGAVGDVAAVGGALVRMRHPRVHHPDRKPQPVVQLAHLRGIAAGQVVVDGDHVHALAFQRVQVHRQGRGQGLAFAGAHLGDLAAVQDHAADQLHVEVAHPEHPDGGFAADRERLRQQLVQRFALADAPTELFGLGLQRLIGEPLHLRFQRIDLLDDAVELLEQAFVAAAEDAGEQAVEHGAGSSVAGCAPEIGDSRRHHGLGTTKTGAGRPFGSRIV